MRLWRAFVCWIASDAIEKAYGAGRKSAQQDTALGLDLIKQMAFAHGELSGRTACMEEIERIVEARTCGAGDYVQAEDIENLKKRSLH